LPAQAFLRDVQELDFSRDNQWIAWVDAAGKLWRARIDGKDQLQLSPDAMTVYMMRWSPDGNSIAVMGRERNQPWQLYLFRSDGSRVDQLIHGPQDIADPAWSADGKSIAFGRPPNYLASEKSPWLIKILDLGTKEIKAVPGSEGLFSPRWSPDGRYLVAITQDEGKLMLFDIQAQRWKQIADMPVSNPRWSADSKAIYVQNQVSDQKPIFRISIPDGRSDQICTLDDFSAHDATDYSFFGLAPGSVPIVRTRVNGDIYSLKLSRQ